MLAGYGLTESIATVSCENLYDHEIGSVGKLMPHMQVKFGENDEILLKGPAITKGYYKKEAITKASFTEDGWFRTGDAGYIKDGFLFLTERIKDLFKTSNGKYIAPQAIETKMVVDRYIDQISIIADERKFVAALIVPDYKLVEKFAADKGIQYASMAELLKHDLAGIEDELLLTILTMTMAMIVCLQRGMNIELTAATIIVVNILGYLIGNLGARIFQTFMDQAFAVHAMSTSLTTEILGWGIVTMTTIFHVRKRKRHNLIDTPYLSWLILAMCGVFILRLCIVLVFSSDRFSSGDVFGTATKVFSNSFSLITLICINVLYIRYSKKHGKRWSGPVKVLVFIAFMLIGALLESILVGLDLSFRIKDVFNKEFPFLYATSLLAQFHPLKEARPIRYISRPVRSRDIRPIRMALTRYVSHSQ